MLKGDLYTLEALQREDKACSAELALIPQSRIYAAHFPGKPITPGVCMLQMCVELASEASGRHLELSEARDIRFLVPLVPESGARVKIDFTLPDRVHRLGRRYGTCQTQTHPAVEEDGAACENMRRDTDIQKCRHRR